MLVPKSSRPEAWHGRNPEVNSAELDLNDSAREIDLRLIEITRERIRDIQERALAKIRAEINRNSPSKIEPE